MELYELVGSSNRFSGNILQYNWANQEYADTNGCHFQMHRKKQRQFYYYKTIPTPYLLFRFSQGAANLDE
jgi:hypothetical protein